MSGWTPRHCAAIRVRSPVFVAGRSARSAGPARWKPGRRTSPDQYRSRRRQAMERRTNQIAVPVGSCREVGCSVAGVARPSENNVASGLVSGHEAMSMVYLWSGRRPIYMHTMRLIFCRSDRATVERTPSGDVKGVVVWSETRHKNPKLSVQDGPAAWNL